MTVVEVAPTPGGDDDVVVSPVPALPSLPSPFPSRIKVEDTLASLLAKFLFPYLALLFLVDILLVIFASFMYARYYHDPATPGTETTLYVLAVAFCPIVLFCNIHPLTLSIRLFRKRTWNVAYSCLQSMAPQVVVTIAFFGTMIAMCSPDLLTGIVRDKSLPPHGSHEYDFDGDDFRSTMHRQPLAMALYVLIIVRFALPVASFILSGIGAFIFASAIFFKWAIYDEIEKEKYKTEVPTYCLVDKVIALVAYACIMFDILLVILAATLFSTHDYKDMNILDPQGSLYYLAVAFMPVILAITAYLAALCYWQMRTRLPLPRWAQYVNSHILCLEVAACVAFFAVFVSFASVSTSNQPWKSTHIVVNYDNNININNTTNIANATIPVASYYTSKDPLTFSNEQFSSMLHSSPPAMSLYVLLLVRLGFPILVVASSIVIGIIFIIHWALIDD
eukprot:TRINITY_DN13526_c0_g1_i1.p1 TRINITY_DN13526_c0_g1~~TRINITY_DN13526_c0_g1_i1.p1  ORF type:complete len:473 (-),score=58.77 TRINITY_DN13526_c0_g1_i1:40-1386(-)